MGHGLSERSPGGAESRDVRGVHPSLADAVRDGDLGVPRGLVELSAPSPRWGRAFDQVASVLRDDPPEGVVAVEHIGSTAVPGLSAKAILDLAVGIAPMCNIGRIDDWLLSLGFIFRGERDNVRPDRMYGLELQRGVRLINVHVVVHDGPEWRHYVSFRDHLRRNRSAREAYGAVKKRLAGAHPGDRLAYIAGKEPFILSSRSSRA